ncbi:hypothetical protein Q5P01_018247 [Channa striata]|uniref:Uncharacterized protein n=1 Tax=Channa striata TaxID=64152 RepID=A0AA88S8R2_CHASR|nr:hypothetical protein Q5P01_018247 [Channa striata]
MNGDSSALLITTAGCSGSTLCRRWWEEVTDFIISSRLNHLRRPDTPRPFVLLTNASRVCRIHAAPPRGGRGDCEPPPPRLSPSLPPPDRLLLRPPRHRLLTKDAARRSGGAHSPVPVWPR